jgi:hypothetical protein
MFFSIIYYLKNKEKGFIGKIISPVGVFPNEKKCIFALEKTNKKQKRES